MKSPNDRKAVSPGGCPRTPEGSSDPILLMKLHDTANWLLDRVDGN
ncbi:MAG: hypothetical protein V3V05_08205 [Pontiella sp.]